VRYKQTAIGAAWAVVRPLLTMLVFTVIFGRVARLPSDGTAPYPLMVFAGGTAWRRAGKSWRCRDLCCCASLPLSAQACGSLR
jgi:ABC-type polysaccharide/polyol phosphate export permease